jgi:hypothetical protein
MAFFDTREHYLRMRWLAVVLLVALPSRAGVVYDFVTTIETPRSTARHSRRISSEGQSYRADFKRNGGSIDSVISKDGDQTAIYLDLDKCRWTYRTRVGPLRSSGYFHLPNDGSDDLIGTPQVEHHIDGEETIAGFRATKHVIDVKYRLVTILADTPVRGSVSARVTLWTVEELPPLPMSSRLRTGHPLLDGQLGILFEQVRGLVVRHDLVVTRAFDDGVPQTERTLTTITNLRVAELPESLFAVPDEASYGAGFR